MDLSPDRLSSPKVDDEFELGGLFHRQVGRLGPFEDSVHEIG
jgi:hypothetical protein